MGTDDIMRALEHPLPAGMRDLLPDEARSRRALGRKVLDRFAVHGYALVTPPAFEFADVLERGLGTLDPADVLRFVEPESGEVAALRPDVTPQIARMIATRLRDAPPPFRLCYEGTVLRRRSGRAHKHRQIPQVGVELAGVAGPDGDLELLSVAADALRGAGLAAFTIDVGDAGIVRALLADVASNVAEAISGALARKDDAELEDLARPDPAARAQLATLRALLRLHGGRDALVEGARVVRGTPAESAALRLTQLFDAAALRGLSSHLTVDLGEVRGFAYYTGPIFHIFAAGPGESIGSGGRYDDLLRRFGAPMPAVGFALDLDRLSAALRTAGVALALPDRVVVVGEPDDARVASLRAKGTCAVAVRERGAAMAYARAWGFSHLLDAGDGAALEPVST
jgi:ATP phosphoribosyltransferase regulatory subunit